MVNAKKCEDIIVEFDERCGWCEKIIPNKSSCCRLTKYNLKVGKQITEKLYFCSKDCYQEYMKPRELSKSQLLNIAQVLGEKRARFENDLKNLPVPLRGKEVIRAIEFNIDNINKIIEVLNFE